MNIYSNQILKMVTLSFLFFISCNKPIKRENIETIQVNLKTEEVEVSFDDYFSSRKVIALETNENSIFSQIDRISFYEHKIFVLDRKLNSIFVFNENDGSFLYKIKNIGRGPQEYTGLMDFTIDEKNNNLVLYTHRPYGLYIHKLDGAFVKKVRLDNFYINMASIDGKILFLNRDVKNECLLFDYNLAKAEEQGFLDISDRDKTYSDHILGTPFLTKDKNIHLSFPYSETIYEKNEKGVEAKYYVDFGTQKMPEDIYKLKKSFRELFDYGETNNYGYGICNFRENKDYITFNYQLTNLAIYSKKTKKTKKIKRIINDDMVYGNYLAHDGNDNNFVLQYPAKVFKKQMNIYKEEDIWDKVPNHIKKLDSLVTDNDNPVLMIYKFK
ncbi:6-bladed beta-propeller [Flavobacterium commune]|uniref:6-bladed beta-propeller n=1 Tax=Flavobacterium commune TaxID=1306519 RepID=A0A1D9PDE4_9FLAO|nr:6-bladed beta-propeller [Flavobacterium commune]APA00345.1 hypothetical protein BIW12_13425 [Flavobacterium commune]